MGCECGKFLKIMVMTFNLLLFFIGCAVLGFGIYLQLEMATYFDLLGDMTINSATLFIVIGAIIMIISFFGCCGACMQNSCMMKTFAVLIAFMLLVEVVLVVVIFVYKDEIKTQMKNGLENYNTTEKDGVTKVWDTLQQNYHCCGVEEPRDWEPKLEKSVPDSCCIEETLGCGENARATPDNKKIFATGCFEKLALDVKLTGTIGGVLVALQLVAILVACCMGRRMANPHDEEYELASQ